MKPLKFINKKESILLLASLFLVTMVLRFDFRSNQVQAEERYTDLQTFTKVLNFIQQFYVEPVDVKKLIYGAVKGMLRELDPHTNFLPPDIYKDFETETAGQFGGIGIEISVQNSVLTVISPIEDTPAWEAGIQPGDKLIEINGTSTKGLSLVEASQLMKGAKGSKVKLVIVRDSVDKPLEISITRGVVKIKSVKPTELGDGLYYVRLTSFIENTGKDLEKFLSEKSKPEMRGLIMDLRKNPGGLLDQAILVSDLFLKEGTIVSTMGRNPDSRKVEMATKKGKFTEVPLIVLLNEHSASASEIVAGALQDNKRALIMGQKSFGKGSVQQVVKLGDGSGLKLTVARYYTPSGKSIQSEGITPDVEIEDFEMQQAKQNTEAKGPVKREKDIAGHLLGEKEKKEKLKKEEEKTAWWKDVASKKEEAKSPKEKLLASDYQVFQAYNYLKAWKVIKTIK